MSGEDAVQISQKRLEYAYLSAVLNDDSNLAALMATVPGVEVFTVEFAKIVAVHMVGLADRGMSIDFGSVMASIADNGDRFDAPEFAEIISACDSPLHASTHLRMLVERWRIRDVAGKAQKLLETVRSKSWSDVRGTVSEIASSIIENGTETRKLSQSEAVQNAIAERERIAAGGPAITGVTIETGIGR